MLKKLHNSLHTKAPVLYHAISFLFNIKKNYISQEYSNLSFSQEGEDLVLYRLIGKKRNGFYVDIGAHHPFRYSNTYKFYLEGWRGINIDPLPGSMKKFNASRPKDINLEIPIMNDVSKDLTYFMFDQPEVNTFDPDMVEQWKGKASFNLVEKVHLKPYRLAEVLEKHLPAGQFIDFFSIDVEGMDLEVLKSNDWKKFRPQYVVAESLFTKLVDDLDSDIARFLNEQGYELIAKTRFSLIFTNRDFLN